MYASIEMVPMQRSARRPWPPPTSPMRCRAGAAHARIHATLSDLQEVAKKDGKHLVHRRSGEKGAGTPAHLQQLLDKAQAALQNAETNLGRIAAAGQSAAGHASGAVNAGSGAKVADDVAGLFGDVASGLDALGDLIGGPLGAALSAVAGVIGSIGDLISSAFGSGTSADGSGGQSTDPGTDPDPGTSGPDGGGEEGGPGGGETGGCFTASTRVLMADGSRRPIGELAVGDIVVGRDEVDGVTHAGAIARVFVHDVARTLTLRLDDGTDIETTAVHRFATPGGQFVDADTLRPGDELVTRQGNRAVVHESIQVDQPATVYNVPVDRWHTYFVGDLDIWVHNAKIREPEEPDDPTNSDDD